MLRKARDAPTYTKVRLRASNLVKHLNCILILAAQKRIEGGPFLRLDFVAALAPRLLYSTT